MNKNLTIAIGIVIVLALGAWAVWAFSGKQGSAVPTGAATSTTVSDTSSVPPAATSTPETESDTAALNQRIYKFGVHITPLEVVGDSRCPMGVYCIQAGAVTIKAKLEDGTHSEIVTMVTGSPIAFGNKHVTLMSVTPPKSQHSPLKPSDYRFTFSVAYGMGGDAPN